ncbi:unnamed protein product [Clonostachys rosea f. rosea IK726]|uniref:Uncharacterized protein n=1 Tax=Clonostachys rosea f. rosea IK726 TaxID=1349383 RepID=A0ACA9TF53_BIOOC|nr:unnamed protein product [Clonostachys rosea f. rosea IK726]
MEMLGVAANVIAVVDLSAKISSLCVQYGREVKNAAADIERLRKEIASLQGVTKAVHDLLNGPDGKKLDKSQLETYLNECVLLLKNLELKLTPRTARKLIGKMGFTTLKWPFQSKEVDDLVRQFSKFVQAIAHTLQVEQTSTLLRVERTILSIDWQTVLRSLPVAEGASYDSRADQYHPTCLPNTRVDLLRHIREWAFDPHAKPIFWLNGMAGTGKSTISRTIAKDFAQSGRLGASFFFKRGEADRGSISKFFTTIAAQLVHKEPAISVTIKEVIDADPYIAGKTARDQFDKLIVQPLASTLAARGQETLVVVVDALDECDKDEDIKLLIHLFSGTKDILCQKLRILVTSRPELPIRLGFQTATGSYQDVVLHEVPPDIIKHDLTAFFHHELTQIKNEFNQSVSQDRQLQFDWPGEERTQALVNMAIPLFIFAATVCRSLADRRIGHPNQQLRDVLRFQGQSHTSQLSATYQPILNKLLNGLDKEQQTSIIKRFQLIVGSIVLLGNPLPAPAISRLLNIAREEVDVQLDLLHSVLDIPSSEESPVRIFHLSFHDFLVDSRYHEEHLFWVDKKEVHSRLVMCCLEIMNKNLRTDICNLSQPGTDRATVSPHTIRSCIQPETQYACVYWVYHQQQAGLQDQGNGPVYTFLERHFLHWLEALSLLGRATDSLSMISELREYCNQEQSQMLEDFLQDAQRFIRTNIATINTTPLQLYSSILAFTPKNSIIRKEFIYEIPNWICRRPESEDNWDQCEQILEGHRAEVRAVAFSPDGTVTIRLWRASDGTCMQKLEGHSSGVSSWVRAVVFSPDGTVVASASDDKTIRLWRVNDGTCMQKLEGHSKWVRAVVFSPDGTVVASASDDKTIRLWRVNDGTCTQKLEGYSSAVGAVAFSPDGTVVASASDDKTIRLWRVNDGTCTQKLEGHSNWVTAVAFSPDGTVVASASYDKTIRLWRVNNSTCTQKLEGHSSWVRAVAFSPDGTVVASVSDDKTIRLWRASNGTCTQKLEGHSSWVRAMAFSPDGTVLQFDSQGLYLWTDAGAISIHSPALLTDLDEPEKVLFPSNLSSIGIASDGCWIISRTMKLLWLPPSFRPTCSIIRGASVVIGCSSGRVIFMSFDPDKLSAL